MKTRLAIYTLAIMLFVSVLFNIGQNIYIWEQTVQLEQLRDLVGAIR